MTRRLIGVAVLALALAGCGGNPKADPSPTKSTTTPTSTASSAPELPDAAKANTKAGALAFVRYYIHLINYAQATGDVGPLRRVESDACASCTRVRESVEHIYGSGGSIEGGTWRPHMTIALQNADDSWLVSGNIRFDPETVRKTANSTAVQGAGGSAVAHMKVRQSASGWTVLEWSRES